MGKTTPGLNDPLGGHQPLDTPQEHPPGTPPAISSAYGVRPVNVSVFAVLVGTLV